MEEPFMRLSSMRLFTISRFWLLWIATVFANLAFSQCGCRSGLCRALALAFIRPLCRGAG
jgi:hypothetical protein